MNCNTGTHKYKKSSYLNENIKSLGMFGRVRNTFWFNYLAKDFLGIIRKNYSLELIEEFKDYI